MTKAGKLIRKILMGQNVTYRDAEHVLLNLGFELKISGSHHLFRKKGYAKTVSIKKRHLLLHYQIEAVQGVLKNHGY